MSLFCTDILRLPSRSSTPTVSVQNLSDWQLTEGYLPTARDPADFWLRPPTLQFLSDCPQGLDTEAILLRHTPSGREVVLTLQTFYFRAAQQVSASAKGETSRWDVRRRLLAQVAVKTLVLGQLLTSGDVAQEGMSQLSPAEIARVLPAVAQTLLYHRRGYTAVLLKDLMAEQHPAVARLKERGFASLPADPVMQLDLRPWTTLEEYLGSLTSKYRVRYRRARLFGQGIRRQRLTKVDAGLLPRLYALYMETSSGANFNVTALTPDYFRWLLDVGEVVGYYTETGELVGFTTAIANGRMYQAHYLGLRDTYKRSHHLYHNMLCDLLEAGLSGGYNTLDYGRTALEIKSSLGAIPFRYANLLRLRSVGLNGLVPRFVSAVFAAPKWQARQPFRLP